ncbi:Neurochondrin-domain-containing protein [Phycomyces blakesleeanus]|uniref:Neurochondrin-domain-containing protein n=1 Tax=Phycomyces blakesleeanus TaxID=4837 RepID=A0ABR3AUK6_PHYBL
MTANVSHSDKDRMAEIDRCLGMIGPSSSDESKFVGMLNENAEIPESVLREIAVNILACFARYETMATSQPMVDKIPGLSIILTPNDSSDLTQEILHILLCVAVNKEGLVKMLDPDVLKNILEVFVETEKEEERKLCVDLIKAIYGRTCHRLHEAKVPSLMSSLRYSLKTLFGILASVFNQDQAKLKFYCLDILANVLPDLPDEVVQAHKKEVEPEATWLVNIRRGLRQIVTNKVACLVRYYGSQWLFSPLLRTKQARRLKDQDGDKKAAEEYYAEANFPALLIHIVSVEARVMVDQINDIRQAAHNQTTPRQVEADKRHKVVLPLLFEILEGAIEYLSESFDENEESQMDPDMLLKLRTTLSDTMDVVMELLQFIQNTTLPEESEDDPVAQACMRIVALWLAEEGYEMPEGGDN